MTTVPAGVIATVPTGVIVIAIAVTGMVTVAGIAAAIGMTDGGMTDGGTTVAIIIAAMAA